MLRQRALTTQRLWRDAAPPEVAAAAQPAGTLESALRAELFQEADVLLFHHYRDPLASIVRFLSGSFWNHAAIVVRRNPDDPEPELEIVEAHWRGVRRLPLRQCLDDSRRKALIAVRRVPPGLLDEPARRRIARQAAKAVGSPYDLRLLLRLARFALRDLVHRYHAQRPALPALVHLAAGLTGKATGFICSGLVQWAYWATVEPGLRDRVVFLPSGAGEVSEALLRETTPGHLATSPNLQWVCLLYNGQVWALTPPVTEQAAA